MFRFPKQVEIDIDVIFSTKVMDLTLKDSNSTISYQLFHSVRNSTLLQHDVELKVSGQII